MLITIFLFLLGLVLLIIGARFLVTGASALALIFKISPLIIGLTIVAFGTSAPEIAVTALAAWRGEGGIVIGNVVGSNIFNILLVLGLSAAIFPLIVHRRLIRLDVPLMIAASLFVWFLAMFGKLFWWEGLLLFIALIAYITFTIRMAHKKKEEGEEISNTPLWLALLLIAAGIVLLAFGSDWLVSSAADIALYLGVSQLYIGLTLVAIATSLPEMVVCLVAVFKKEGDMAVGNIIGSNIFNLLGVLAISTFFSKSGIPIEKSALSFDFPVMVGVAIATLPIFLSGHIISRWEGFLFLFYYVVYMIYLLLHNAHFSLFPLFTTAILFFILPLTLVTLVIGVVRHLQKK